MTYTNGSGGLLLTIRRTDGPERSALDIQRTRVVRGIKVMYYMQCKRYDEYCAKAGKGTHLNIMEKYCAHLYILSRATGWVV
jgi:hypothetical protein